MMSLIMLISIYSIFSKYNNTNKDQGKRFLQTSQFDKVSIYENFNEWKDYDKGECLPKGGKFLFILKGKEKFTYLTINTENMILEFKDKKSKFIEISHLNRYHVVRSNRKNQSCLEIFVNYLPKNITDQSRIDKYDFCRNTSIYDDWEKKLNEIINCRHLNNSKNDTQSDNKTYNSIQKINNMNFFLNNNLLKKKVFDYVSQQLKNMKENQLKMDEFKAKEKHNLKRLKYNIHSPISKIPNLNHQNLARKRTTTLLFNRHIDPDLCYSNRIMEIGIKRYIPEACIELFKSNKKELGNCNKLKNFCKVCCKQRIRNLEGSKKCKERCEKKLTLRKIFSIKNKKIQSRLNEISIKINEINNTRNNIYFSQSMKDELIHKKKKELKNFIMNQMKPRELVKEHKEKLLSLIKPLRKIYLSVLEKIDIKTVKKDTIKDIERRNSNSSMSTSYHHVNSSRSLYNDNRINKTKSINIINFTKEREQNKYQYENKGKIINITLIKSNKSMNKFMNSNQSGLINQINTHYKIQNKSARSNNSLGKTDYLVDLRRTIMKFSKNINIKIKSSTKSIDSQKLIIVITNNIIKLNKKIFDKDDTIKIIEYVSRILQRISNINQSKEITADKFLKFIINITNKLSKLYKKRRYSILSRSINTSLYYKDKNYITNEKSKEN